MKAHYAVAQRKVDRFVSDSSKTTTMFKFNLQTANIQGFTNSLKVLVATYCYIFMNLMDLPVKR